MLASDNPFAIRGRLGQKVYWQFVGTILTIRILAVVVVMFRPDWAFLLRTDFLIVAIALLIGRRMRDFGVSAAWGWAGVAVISLILPLALAILWPHPHDPADPLDILPAWAGLLVFVSLLGLIIWVGSKEGDAGPNRFGDPATGTTRANIATRIEPRFEE
jgi:uncharacterized membrane protein YhaH (DUF805 family)